MNLARRTAWVVAFIAALPGFAFGLVTLYAILVVPVTFTLGVVFARWEPGIRAAQVIFAAIVLFYAFLLARGFGSSDWWFFAIYGVSALLAVLATFKVGMVARTHLR